MNERDFTKKRKRWSTYVGRGTRKVLLRKEKEEEKEEEDMPSIPRYRKKEHEGDDVR